MAELLFDEVGANTYKVSYEQCPYTGEPNREIGILRFYQGHWEFVSGSRFGTVTKFSAFVREDEVLKAQNRVRGLLHDPRLVSSSMYSGWYE